ncbi:MAG TPA: alkaline phytoceramidase [Planctomycetota bacterium]|nr:alkaline phytoceramidase [Planctomycetota bacterium]
MESNRKTWVLAALAVGAIATVLLLPPIRQWADYHDFADTRTFWGIPNALNVLSNLPFLGAGVWGLGILARSRGSFRHPGERGPVGVLLLSFILVTLGSGLYHWSPNDRTLFWDRLSLGLVFGSFLGITVMERISLRGGALLFVPLVTASAASVVHWAATGDLRFWVLAQGGAILGILVLIVFFAPRYTGDRALLGVVALYGLAKAFELLDGPIYRMGHLVSGHTLKHLVGAAAGCLYVGILGRRQPAQPLQSLVARGTGA